MALAINRKVNTAGKATYGQVEPNHLSAQRTSQIYAQLPAAEGIDELENGQYVKYDYANNQVDFVGAGEWMMVFNEVKLYDDRWRESYANYAQKRTDACDGVIVPRVIKTNIGDIYTTNTVTTNTYKVADQLVPAAGTGLLTKADEHTPAEDTMRWQVVAETTMPDGAPALKLMRIK